nr:zinc finger, CCHC-type [Tanacetum cinerariifolium]GEZ05371.1 zinc finger, CCHC-type [Tanacetum cinerariifolium]
MLHSLKDQRNCWTYDHDHGARNLTKSGKPCPYDMLQKLKTLFAQQVEHKLLQIVRDFHSCKQEEVSSVSSYVLKIKSYIDNLERLGHPVSLNLGVSLILISMRTEFNSFVQNYNMHSIRKTVNELHAMLKLHEKTLPKKDAHVLHYLAELLKNKKLSQGASDLGLKGSRKLKPGALSLYVGNENQIVKTIKSLRSDLKGEYIRKQFLDHLKEHGIISHRTPPDTPQHNGLSKRRNGTLLDMVHSMTSQTTLPKSFWDYALETTTRILNIISTKKVETTPYKVWHRKAR